MAKSWAFESQRLMFPLMAQQGTEGNKMLVGAVQGAAHEMSQTHLKQQSFDLHMMRNQQLVAAQAASLDLRARKTMVDEGQLVLRQNMLAFEKMNEVKKERTRYYGRKFWDEKAGEGYYVDHTGNPKEFTNKAEMEKAWAGNFPDKDIAQRKVAVDEQRAGTYSERADLGVRKQDETERRNDFMESMKFFDSMEKQASNVQREEIAKERNRVREKYEAAGGLGGEIARGLGAARTESLEVGSESKRIEMESRILKDAREALGKLRERVPFGIDEKWSWTGTTRGVSHEKDKFRYPKSVRDDYKREEKEIIDRRNRRLGTPSKPVSKFPFWDSLFPYVKRH